MQDVKTFLASSTVEFQRERVELGNYIRSLDEKFTEYGYHFHAVMCEDMSHAVTREGSQAAIDSKIPDCQFFVLLAGKELGRYTEGEFDLALKEFQTHGSPKIYTYFRRVPEEEESQSIVRFKRRLRRIGSGHYWQDFDTLAKLELNLTGEYMQYTIEHKPDTEFNRDMYRKGNTGKALTARDKLLAAIAANRRKAAELARGSTAARENAQSAGTMPDIFLLYEEIVRLAKHYLEEGGAYREELEALYDYAHFLHRNGADERAIQIGNLLDGAYNPNDGDPEHWDNQAALDNLLAECHMARGECEKAEPLYQKALELYRRLEKEDPDAGADIAETCGALADVLKKTFRYGAAARLYREALARYREFALAEPEEYAPALSDTCENLALFVSGRKAVLMEPPMTAENFKLFRDCVKAIDDYVEEPNRKRLEEFDAALGILKTLLPYLHFPDEGKRLLRKAEEAAREATKDKPDQYELVLAAVCNNWGEELRKANRMEAAETLYREALEICRKLARDNPAAYEPYVAMTCNNLAILLSDTNRPEEAEKFHLEALEIYRKLARDNPAAYEPDVATTCNNLAVLLKDTNRPEEAETFYREALEIYRKLAQSDSAAYEPDVAMTCNNLAVLFYETSRPQEAETFYREALEIRRRLAQSDPAAYEPDVAQTCNNLANLLKNTNRPEEAEKFYREALEIYRKSARDNPAAYGPYVAHTCFNLGLFELQVKHNPAAARALFEEAEALLRKYPHLEDRWQDARHWLSCAVAEEAKTIADEAKKE